MIKKRFFIILISMFMLSCEKLDDLANQAGGDDFNSISLASSWDAPCENNFPEEGSPEPPTSSKKLLVIDDASEGHLGEVMFAGLDCDEANTEMEVRFGVSMQYTTTEFEMELNSLKVKYSNESRVTGLNSPSSTDNCGFTDWEVEVFKELMGEVCQDDYTEGQTHVYFTYELSSDGNSITLTQTDDEGETKSTTYSK